MRELLTWKAVIYTLFLLFAVTHTHRIYIETVDESRPGGGGG